jgi:hypothetical protein
MTTGGIMPTYTSSEAAGSVPTAFTDEGGEETAGYGWVVFASVLLAILGVMNSIEGIAAINNARFFVRGADYLIGDLNSWGWVVLCLGVMQLLIAGSVLLQNQFTRWFGLVVLGLNAVAQLLMISAYPLWSLAFLALDIMAIYGLAVYGRRVAG